MSSEELNEYRLFLERISENSSQRSLCEAVLQHKASPYQLNGFEVTGELIHSSLQFLLDSKCPPKLIAPILKEVTQIFPSKSKEYPELCGFDANLQTYNPTKIKNVAVSSIENFCLRLSDNIELNKVLSANNNSQTIDDTPISIFGAIKNKRRYMEDRHTCVDNFKDIYNIENCEKLSFYGVFDGHDGPVASSYASAQMPNILAAQKSLCSNPTKALREAFIETDLGYIDKSIKGGSTAVCALYYRETSRLYVAWVGDSKALLVKNGKIMQIVKPHKPEDPNEKIRICNAGGSVMKWDGVWRVDGLINLSRAIGDAKCKPYLTAEPDIVGIELDKNEDFLVLGCDGLWDHVEEEQVASIIYETIRDDCEKYNQIPELLIEAARNCGSSDNITIVILFFKHPFEIYKKSSVVPIDPMDSAFCDYSTKEEKAIEEKCDTQFNFKHDQPKDFFDQNDQDEFLQKEKSPKIDLLNESQFFNNELNNMNNAKLINDEFDNKLMEDIEQQQQQQQLQNQNDHFDGHENNGVNMAYATNGMGLHHDDDENENDMDLGPATCVDFTGDFANASEDVNDFMRPPSNDIGMKADVSPLDNFNFAESAVKQSENLGDNNLFDEVVEQPHDADSKTDPQLVSDLSNESVNNVMADLNNDEHIDEPYSDNVTEEEDTKFVEKNEVESCLELPDIKKSEELFAGTPMQNNEYIEAAENDGSIPNHLEQFAEEKLKFGGEEHCEFENQKRADEHLTKYSAEHDMVEKDDSGCEQEQLNDSLHENEKDVEEKKDFDGSHGSPTQSPVDEMFSDLHATKDSHGVVDNEMLDNQQSHMTFDNQIENKLMENGNDDLQQHQQQDYEHEQHYDEEDQQHSEFDKSTEELNEKHLQETEKDLHCAEDEDMHFDQPQKDHAAEQLDFVAESVANPELSEQMNEEIHMDIVNDHFEQKTIEDVQSMATHEEQAPNSNIFDCNETSFTNESAEQLKDENLLEPVTDNIPSKELDQDGNSNQANKNILVEHSEEKLTAVNFENVSEHCVKEKIDESDDEWNYMQVKEGEGEKQETENSEKGFMNSVTEGVLLQESPISEENSNAKDENNQKGLTIDLQKIAEIEDMNYQLNPDAKEFIPTSPPDFAKLVNGFPKFQQRLEDDVVAQSPRKACVNMENIQVPEEEMFDKEADQRPHEVDEDMIIPEKSPVACGILCGDENRRENDELLLNQPRAFDTLINDAANEMNFTDEIITTKADAAPLVGFKPVAEFEQLKMDGSIYIENHNSVIEKDETELLNQIQMIPDEIKDGLVAEQHNSEQVLQSEAEQMMNKMNIEKDITNLLDDIKQLDINVQENQNTIDVGNNLESAVDTVLASSEIKPAATISETPKTPEVEKATVKETVKSAKAATPIAKKSLEASKVMNKKSPLVTDAKKAKSDVKEIIKKPALSSTAATKPKTMTVTKTAPPKTVTMPRPRTAPAPSTTLKEKKPAAPVASKTISRPESAGVRKTAPPSTLVSKPSAGSASARASLTAKPAVLTRKIEPKTLVSKPPTMTLSSKPAPRVTESKIGLTTKPPTTLKSTSPRSAPSSAIGKTDSKSPVKLQARPAPRPTSSEPRTLTGPARKPLAPKTIASTKPMQKSVSTTTTTTTVTAKRSTGLTASKTGTAAPLSSTIRKTTTTTTTTKSNSTKTAGKMGSPEKRPVTRIVAEKIIVESSNIPDTESDMNAQKLNGDNVIIEAEVNDNIAI